jgi:hypothetical protein
LGPLDQENGYHRRQEALPMFLYRLNHLPQENILIEGISLKLPVMLTNNALNPNKIKQTDENFHN